MRAVMVPFVFWCLMTGRMQLALALFVVAGASDALDGYLAKRFNWQTELGAYLDPVADKLLLLSVFIALGTLKALPLWLVVAVVSRDILIIVAVVVSWLMNHPVRIQPHMLSKAHTLAQIVLASAVMANLGFGLGLDGFVLVLVWTTGLLTVLSLAAYLRTWLDHMSRAE